MEPPALAAKPPSPRLDEMAEACLQYMVQNPDQLAEFMAQSGVGPSELRGLIGTPGFNHGLIDYVVGNEPLLVAVAAQSGTSPEAFTRLWAKLHHAEH